MNHLRAVIVTGGRVGSWTLQHISPEDYLIGADHGAAFLVQHGYRPDVALGDFDSVSESERQAINRASHMVKDCDPVDKNYTDTELALRAAIDSGAKQVVILGATGTRLDHTLANIQLLKTARDHGLNALIADEHNKMQLAADELRVEQDPQYRYVSLVPLTPAVTGITLQGFKYPLHDATLVIGQSLGISNELAGDVSSGVVQLRSGLLLVIQSRD